MTQSGPSTIDRIPLLDPRPRCRLVGEDGNAFAIIGRVKDALRGAGASRELVAQYQRESTSGDYDNLLRVAAEYVDDDDI